MHVELNGEPRIVPDGAAVASLIAELDPAGRRRAVEVNEHAAPRSRHAVAMRRAVEAGREAFLAGRMPRRRHAGASSPLDGTFV